MQSSKKGTSPSKNEDLELSRNDEESIMEQDTFEVEKRKIVTRKKFGRPSVLTASTRNKRKYDIVMSDSTLFQSDSDFSELDDSSVKQNIKKRRKEPTGKFIDDKIELHSLLEEKTLSESQNASSVDSVADKTLEDLEDDLEMLKEQIRKKKLSTKGHRIEPVSVASSDSSFQSEEINDSLRTMKTKRKLALKPLNRSTADLNYSSILVASTQEKMVEESPDLEHVNETVIPDTQNSGTSNETLSTNRNERATSDEDIDVEGVSDTSTIIFQPSPSKPKGNVRDRLKSFAHTKNALNMTALLSQFTQDSQSKNNKEITPQEDVDQLLDILNASSKQNRASLNNSVILSPNKSVGASPSKSGGASPNRSVGVPNLSLGESPNRSVRASPRISNKSVGVSPSRSIGASRFAGESPIRSVGASPIKSVRESPNKSVTLTPNKPVRESPIKSVRESPNKSVTSTPNKSVTSTPNKSVRESPNKSVRESPIKSLRESPNMSLRMSPRISNKSIGTSPNKSVRASPNKSVRESPNKSVRLSPRISNKSVRASLNSSVGASPIKSVRESPNKSVGVSPSRSIGASPNGSLGASPIKSVRVSPRISNKSVGASPNRSIRASLNNFVGASPIKSVRESPIKSVRESPNKSLRISPRISNKSVRASPNKSVGVSPSNSIGASPTGSVGASPIKSVRLSPNKSVRASPRKSNKSDIVSLYQSIGSSPNESPRKSLSASPNMSVRVSSEVSPNKSTTASPRVSPNKSPIISAQNSPRNIFSSLKLSPKSSSSKLALLSKSSTKLGTSSDTLNILQQDWTDNESVYEENPNLVKIPTAHSVAEESTGKVTTSGTKNADMSSQEMGKSFKQPTLTEFLQKLEKRQTLPRVKTNLPHLRRQVLAEVKRQNEEQETKKIIKKSTPQVTKNKTVKLWKTYPKTYLKTVMESFSKSKQPTSVLNTASKITEIFFKNLFEDASKVSEAANHKCIEGKDILFLIKKQGLIEDDDDGHSLNALVEEYLPMDVWPHRIDGKKLI